MHLQVDRPSECIFDVDFTARAVLLQVGKNSNIPYHKHSVYDIISLKARGRSS